MTTTPLTYDAVLSAPDPRPTDLVSAHYDSDTDEIVATFRDSKIARVATQEFEELTNATLADYQYIDGTRAGVTCLTDNVDFAVAAEWWRQQTS